MLTVVGIGCSRWMLDLMNTPDDVVNHALIYMRVYFLGTIGNLIYNMGSGILRAVGDSKRPLLYLIICCMTNIVLDFYLSSACKWVLWARHLQPFCLKSSVRFLLWAL